MEWVERHCGKSRDCMTYCAGVLALLPIRHRITHKVATLTFQAFHNRQPTYLYQLLNIYSPARQLRSSGAGLLVKPETSNKTPDPAFAVAAATAWNRLPLKVRTATTTEQFSRALKTHLFTLDLSCGSPPAPLTCHFHWWIMVPFTNWMIDWLIDNTATTGMWISGYLKKMPSRGVLLINVNQLIKDKGLLWEILINILLFPNDFYLSRFLENLG